MATTNQFSNYSPKGTSTVMLPEWTQFLANLNLKLNQLFNLTTYGTAKMNAGTVTIPIRGIKATSNVQAIMEIGGTQTGFLQVNCSLNSVTVKSTVNTDAGTIFYLVNF